MALRSRLLGNPGSLALLVLGATMPRLEEHCAESVTMFGGDFGEVHRWRDAFADTEAYGMRHRRVRHHDAGIREAVRLFGAEAGPVARRHIVADLQEEGWTESDPYCFGNAGGMALQ